MKITALCPFRKRSGKHIPLPSGAFPERLRPAGIRGTDSGNPAHPEFPAATYELRRSAPMNFAALLRRAALIEGASFLVLLFIAMPLKYFAGQPMAVKITGMIHGMLFLLFCLALAVVHFRSRWPVGRSGLVFLSSLVPLGPFLLDRKLREWSRNPEAREPE